MASKKFCPEFPEFMVEKDRLKTFEAWPEQMKQRPEQLADAGFFYTHKGDRVICFCCGGGLSMWDPRDDPWEQHVLWYESCDYARLVKTPLYFKFIKRKFKEVIESLKKNTEKLPPTLSTEKEEDTDKNFSMLETPLDEYKIKKEDEWQLCRICFVEKYNTVFSPCGHVVACGKCASTQRKCPICREGYENIVQIYLP